MSLPRRIVKETQRLTQEPVPGITAIPFEDNMRYFNVIISGPDDSPYEAGVFRLELFLPADYPMAPPKVRFLTKIYHPNVDKLGRICLDILKDKWSPALIRTVLLSIQARLARRTPAIRWTTASPTRGTGTRPRRSGRRGVDADVRVRREVSRPPRVLICALPGIPPTTSLIPAFRLRVTSVPGRLAGAEYCPLSLEFGL